MTNPISNPDLMQRIVDSIRVRSKDKIALPPQPIDPDEAAAQCLAVLTDPDAVVLSAEAFDQLAKRNAAMLNAPASEIKATLTRQVVLLEAAATRFLSKASTATNPIHVCTLMKISLSAERALIATLGAIHQMNESEKVVNAIDA